MPTVTGTVILANEEPLDSAEVAFAPAHNPAFLTDNRMVSARVVRTITNAAGEYSTVLAPGWYGVTFDGRDAFDIAVPDVEGPLTIANLVVVGGIPAVRATVVWFNDVQHMVTEDSRVWVSGRTRNSYNSDGIISGWDRVLVTDPIAADLIPNGDSILATQDGFALCVRTFIS